MEESKEEQLSAKTGSEININSDIKPDEQGRNSQNQNSIQRDASRSILTRSNIGANSMQKLTGVASRAQLLPQADMQNEITVSQQRFTMSMI